MQLPEANSMSTTSFPMVSLLRERMQWHQARQKLLAENVSNADTPGFRPRDLAAFRAAAPGAAAGSAVVLQRTSPQHLGASEARRADDRPARSFETRPSGNGVNLEDEMLKVAENQSEYQLATTLYQKSLAMLRSAAGVKGA
jgi:flagellar basal-body rod protein FlgB